MISWWIFTIWCHKCQLVLRCGSQGTSTADGNPNLRVPRWLKSCPAANMGSWEIPELYMELCRLCWENPSKWWFSDFMRHRRFFSRIYYFILNIFLFLHWYYTSLIIHLLRKYNRHLWLMIGTLTPSTIYRFFHMWKIEATHFLQRSCRFSWRRFHIPPIDQCLEHFGPE